MGALVLLAVGALPSTPGLGEAAGRCRAREQGPAFLMSVVGLKDRTGLLRAELYPANDKDFLADDNILVGAGKTFRRVEVRVPATGPVDLCIRAPEPGVYALTVLHDRDGDQRFSLSSDGVGFPGNPRLGWSKPSASAASARVGTGLTRISIVLNYRQNLFSFRPMGRS